MSFNKWVLVILFALGFLYFIEPIARYSCQVVSILAILGGAYGLWTGRMVGEYGIELKGAWAYIFGFAAIALGIWLLFGHCPTIVVP
jgi:hypothetical protein